MKASKVAFPFAAPQVILLIDNNPQVLTSGDPYSKFGATASDNVESDLTNSIVIAANTKV